MDFFILVKKEEKEVKIKLSSGKVSEDTLQHAFFLEKDLRVSLFKDDFLIESYQDAYNSVFNLGSNWMGQIFYIKFDEERHSRPSSRVEEAQNNTPIYIPVEVDHLVSGIENYLFFEEVGDIKCCFTVLSTFTRSVLIMGIIRIGWRVQNQTTVIICDQEGRKFETKVVESDAEVDFIVVKSEVPLVHKPPVIEFPCKLERYILLGYPNSDTDYQALEGVFSSIERDNEDRMRGSSGCRRGYSGGPIFNYKGQLLGINVANDSSIKFTGLTMQNTIGDLMDEVNATFPFLSIIVPAAFVAFKYKDF